MMIRNKTITVPVVSVTRLGEMIEVRLKRPHGFTFAPGECIDLYHPTKNTGKPYSLASSSRADCIKLLIKKIPGGLISSYAYDLMVNDMVRISAESYGYFRPGKTDNPFVFIATGTGIAPFMSYLSEFTSRSNSKYADLVAHLFLPEQIIHGYRYGEEHARFDPDTVVVPMMCCISKPTPDQLEVISKSPQLYNGRVTDYIRSDKYTINPRYTYYLCGLDSMLSECTEILTDAGVHIDNIVQEMFYF